MENPNNSGIQEWMIGVGVVVGQNHDITVGRVRVNSVLFSTHIVGGIIYTKDVVQKYAIQLKKQLHMARYVWHRQRDGSGDRDILSRGIRFLQN